MTRTQIATADFSCGGMQKGTNGEESDLRDCAWKTIINNRHKHPIIATLSVKKGSKFTDPDAQFPRGGALACARGYRYVLFCIVPFLFGCPFWHRKTCCFLCRHLTGLISFPPHLNQFLSCNPFCYQQPSPTATRGHSTFYFKKRCIMNLYYLIYGQSVPQISRGRAMYSTRRHYCDTWSSL